MASVVRSEMRPRSISANAPISVRKNRPMVVEVSTASRTREILTKGVAWVCSLQPYAKVLSIAVNSKCSFPI